jgi:hypothetical protein
VFHKKHCRTWHFICLISKKGYACTWTSLSVFWLCRYALIIFVKLALYVTTTIKILCMHKIMHVNSIHIHIETILTKLTIFNMSRVLDVVAIILLFQWTQSIHFYTFNQICFQSHFAHSIILFTGSTRVWFEMDNLVNGFSI